MRKRANPLELVPHRHRCGACGHEWVHTMFDARVTDDTHHCPQCRAGPWTERLAVT